MIGKTISHYKILERLGAGGMGVVYKARDTHLGRLVAIKVLPPERVADPERKRRFIQEAKAAGSLNHPNIITIYDITADAGIDFIAMEYVPGKTLDQATPRKGLPLNQALKYGIQIADALSRAHSAGIIHRDLKPANIMVDEHGLVKVLDFGLAKLAEWVESDGLAPTETLNKHTEEGTIIGTAAYMSPEQAQGKRADACSDIFSFGAVLYEMVTSRRAFQGDSKLSTLAAIINQEPAPLPAEIPHDLEKLITRCLRKDPERRFQHMDDVKVALEELKEESDSGRLLMAASRATQRWRFSHWAVALGAGALLAAAGLWLWRTRAEAPAVAFGAVPLTTYTGMESQPSFSPDGNQVAFVWDGAQQDNFDIYIKQIGTENLLRLTRDPAVDSSPAWSPDGRHVAFLRALPGNRAGVFLVPTIGGPECKLAETCLPSFVPEPFLGWSPDGKWLAITDRSSAEEPFGLFLLSIETGEKRRLTSAAGQNARRQRTRVLSQWPKPGFRSDR